MLKMDGFMVCQCICKLFRYNNMFIIVMIVSVLDEDKKVVWDVGMNGFCSKLVDVDYLQVEIVWVMNFSYVGFLEM